MTTTTLPSVADRVAAGAALLDEREPGWAARITVPLDLGDCDLCVLGQLYGCYYDAFGLSSPIADVHPEELGFNAVADEHCEPLTAAWRELIETRRAVAPNA